jgi:hypothetical protein
MDPVQKIWMYNNWIADQNEQAELAKNHAYLVASFWNPEAVQKIVGQDNVHKSTDEEYEESLRIVQDQSFKLMEETVPKRKRRKRGTLQS